MAAGVTVTKSVTSEDALVLSPADIPEQPSDLPDVFDDFERVAAGLEKGSLFVGLEGVKMVLQASEKGFGFYFTPILSSGEAPGQLLPPEWEGRVTRDVVAAFVRADCLLYLRPPGWGAHAGIEHVSDEGVVGGRLDVNTPLIDPLRDSARPDDERTLPLAPEFEAPWDAHLTPWEHVDGLLVTKPPPRAWVRRRVRRVICKYGRWWWELRGLRDCDDPNRYSGMWKEPRPIAMYLGWPAYLLELAGDIRECSCGGRAIQGRTYCGSPDCNRERARRRRRDSRKAHTAMASKDE